METWQAILVALAALVTGLLIPVLVQLRATLRLVGDAAHRIDHLAGRLDAEAMNSLIEGTHELADGVHRMKNALSVASAIGAAVGPAVAAFTHGLAERRADAVNEPTNGTVHGGSHEP